MNVMVVRRKQASLILFMAIVVLLSLGLLISVGQASAGGLWSVWLFNPGDPSNPEMAEPHMVRLHQDGTSETYSLPVAAGTFFTAPPTLNSSGEWIAYCLQDDDGTRLEIHNIYPESTLPQVYNVAFPVVIDLDNAVACDISREAFSTANEDYLAVGIVHNFPGMTPPSPDVPDWELRIIRLSTLETVTRLTADTLRRAEVTTGAATHYLPLVRSYNGATAIFALEPYGAGGWFTSDAFSWDIASDSVVPAEGYGNPTFDVLLGTNERIWINLDVEKLGPPATGSPYHTLLYAPTDGAPYAVFDLPEGLGRPLFINSGQHIALEIPASERFIALARDGSTVSLPVGAYVGSLQAAPGGYGYLETERSTRSVRYLLNRFVNGGQAIESTILWQDDELSWFPVWSSPQSGRPDALPFVPITIAP
jgi:hypothetical protein